MYRCISLIAFVLIATPAFAQEDGGGGGLDTFFGGDVFAGGNAAGNRGAAAARPGAAAVDNLATLRDMLAKASVPLTPEQETAATALLNTEIPLMQAAFREKVLAAAQALGIQPGALGQAGPNAGAAAGQGQRQGQPGAQQGQQGQRQGQQAQRGQQGQQGQQAPEGQQGQQARGGQRPGGQGAAAAAGGQGGQAGPAGQAGAAGGFRGGQAGGQRGAAGLPAALTAPDSPLMTEMRRMNEDLLGKIAATLRPDQQAVIKKWQGDQIRARGGFDALKLIMEEAGAPLTAEQIPQIEALYTQENQTRAQLLREAQGAPLDPARASQLQLQTLTQVVRLLNADQRKALQDSMARTRPQQ